MLLFVNNFQLRQGAAFKTVNLLNPFPCRISYYLLVLRSSVDLILERLCLEGSRRQAKYAVHALAAITKDDGLMSLSVLYKVSFS